MKLNENQEDLRDICWLICPIGLLGTFGLEPNVFEPFILQIYNYYTQNLSFKECF